MMKAMESDPKQWRSGVERPKYGQNRTQATGGLKRPMREEAVVADRVAKSEEDKRQGQRRSREHLYGAARQAASGSLASSAAAASDPPPYDAPLTAL